MLKQHKEGNSTSSKISGVHWGLWGFREGRDWCGLGVQDDHIKEMGGEMAVNRRVGRFG